MKSESVPISELVVDEANCRLHSRRSIDAIISSLKAFGQYRPIVVQSKTKVIVAGNGTYLAAKELGWDKIDCVFIDVDDDARRTIGVLDNRCSDLSSWDESKLRELLYYMDSDMQHIAGFLEADMKEIMHKLDSKDLDDLTAKINEPTETCPHCGFMFKCAD